MQAQFINLFFVTFILLVFRIISNVAKINDNANITAQTAFLSSLFLSGPFMRNLATIAIPELTSNPPNRFDERRDQQFGISYNCC